MRILISAIAFCCLSVSANAEVRISHAQLPETGLLIAQSWSCQARKTCGRIATCDEARWYLRNCSWGGRLDGDSDGVPCESICR